MLSLTEMSSSKDFSLDQLAEMLQTKLQEKAREDEALKLSAQHDFRPLTSLIIQNVGEIRKLVPIPVLTAKTHGKNQVPRLCYDVGWELGQN